MVEVLRIRAVSNLWTAEEALITLTRSFFSSFFKHSMKYPSFSSSLLMSVEPLLKRGPLVGPEPGRALEWAAPIFLLIVTFFKDNQGLCSTWCSNRHWLSKSVLLSSLEIFARRSTARLQSWERTAFSTELAKCARNGLSSNLKRFDDFFLRFILLRALCSWAQIWTVLTSFQFFLRSLLVHAHCSWPQIW
jgi:hypothetical protein